MPKIKASSIEELKARVNIYDVVSAYVSLKKSGSSYKGLSPFTTEKTPSFFVHPDKNYYYCFSTSQGGDIISFIRMKENLSFSEAVEFLANKFNVKLEYEAGGKSDGASASLRKQIYDIHEDAAAWYAENFFAGGEQAAEIRSYWTNERGFSLEDAKTLRIGYAPPSSDPLKKILAQKGYSPEAILASGIFYGRPGERLRDYYARFRARMMIPISDIQGRVIAFTARKTRFTPDIPSEEGKYVNSRETEIFKKNAVVFNLDKAKSAIREKNSCIVVEGQLDAIRMFCAGFKNTVATQGTAAGAEHFALIRRFANKAVLLFDGDAAGRHAALRVIPICIKADIEPFVAPLPDGEDPDSFIKKFGTDAMAELVGNRLQTALSFAARSILADTPNPTASDKRAAMLQLFEIVDNAASRVLRDDYLREISNALVLDYPSVAEDYRARKSPAAPGASPAENPPKKDSSAMLTNAVYDSLMICLYNDGVAQGMADILQDAWIEEASLPAAVLKKILALYREGIGFSVSDIETYFENPEEKNIIYKILSEKSSDIDNPAKVANECIAKIYHNFIKREIEALNAQLILADNNDSAEKFEILKRISALRKLSATPPARIELA